MPANGSNGGPGEWWITDDACAEGAQEKGHDLK